MSAMPLEAADIKGVRLERNVTFSAKIRCQALIETPNSDRLHRR